MNEFMAARVLFPLLLWPRTDSLGNFPFYDEVFYSGITSLRRQSLSHGRGQGGSASITLTASPSLQTLTSSPSRSSSSSPYIWVFFTPCSFLLACWLGN